MLRFVAVLLLLAACTPQADRVVVVKSERRMMLYKDGETLRSYPVALGFAPEGPKRQEGDGRTPEGSYLIDTRNRDSRYFRSLRIDYPAEADVAQALAQGASPGGDIFIHGQPNGATGVLDGDWTDGCIAVDNAAMQEIWDRVPDGTPIEIRP